MCCGSRDGTMHCVVVGRCTVWLLDDARCGCWTMHGVVVGVCGVICQQEQNCIECVSMECCTMRFVYVSCEGRRQMVVPSTELHCHFCVASE